MVSEVTYTLVSIGNLQFTNCRESNQNVVLVFDIRNCFISDKRTVEVDGISTITETMTSRTDDVKKIINGICDEVLNILCCRSSEIIRYTYASGVRTTQICFIQSNYINAKFCNFTPGVDGL